MKEALRARTATDAGILSPGFVLKETQSFPGNEVLSAALPTLGKIVP